MACAFLGAATIKIGFYTYDIITEGYVIEENAEFYRVEGDMDIFWGSTAQISTRSGEEIVVTRVDFEYPYGRHTGTVIYVKASKVLSLFKKVEEIRRIISIQLF